MKLRTVIATVWLLLTGIGTNAQNAPVVLRVGYFPNVTHSQGVIGRATGRFEQALGSGVHVDWKAFNAGPSVIEALFAGALDLAYVGPNPTVAGYTRSRGEALRVIAGATSGGATLVVRPAAGIQKPEDFHGKKIATPQLGNTQDVALRAWLLGHNLQTREKGGDVQVIPIANPDQLTLFLRGEIDAAWAPEPWASLLVEQAHAQRFFDERDLWPNRQFVTAHLIASTRFLREHPNVVKQWLRTHVELTDWINANAAEAKKILNQQIQKDTGKGLPKTVLDDAFSRLQVTYDPIRSSLLTSAQWSFDAGFLGRERPDLAGLYDLSLLNEVLREKKAKGVQ
ncbi:MAG TPA: aliphatic sulfonate ABC transporter substrate-binding protein [Candidatus Dormibacteraeota bacterium]|nr:aliphatic sulfonate ABC transporter substrate-binding protein [Candidatus Dormibacteraeota bacterium]